MSKLIPYIISFGIGATFGYLLRIPLKFESVLFLGISSGSIFGLINLIREFSKERKEKRLKHSKSLVDKNLKSLAKTGITVSNLDLRIFSENMLYHAPDSDYEMYSKDVYKHLESGYFEEVWKHGIERDNLINDHNAKVQEFLDKILSKIIIELKQKIPSIAELDNSGQQPIKYFIPKNLSIGVNSVIWKFYEYGEIGAIDQNFLIKEENNRWRIFTNQVVAESDNKNEVQEIKQIIKGVLGDAFISEDFKTLKKYHTDIKNKHGIFVSGINDIIKNVDNDNPIKGHCLLC